MRILLFIVFFSLNYFLFSQINYKLLIDGHVTAMDHHYKSDSAIINAIIHLNTDLEDEIMAISDTNGYYSFMFEKTAFKSATITIQTSKQTHKANAKCSYYLASRDFAQIKISDNDKPKHIIKNFELSPVEDACMPYLPVILFKNQSLVYDTLFSKSYFNKNDSLLDIPQNGLKQYFKMLNENPNIIIEINAYASFNEKLPQELSELRAEKVKLDLVTLGIKADRIKTKGRGNSELLIKPIDLKKAKTKKEKNILHSKNRRCTLKILSWDHGESPEQLKKNKKYKNEEDE